MLQNVAVIISTIRLAGNDDSEAWDSILQIGHLLFVVALSGKFTVRAPKCPSDDRNSINR